MKPKYKLDENGLPNKAFIRDLNPDEMDDFFEGKEMNVIFDLLTGQLSIIELREEIVDQMNIWDADN